MLVLLSAAVALQRLRPQAVPDTDAVRLAGQVLPHVCRPRKSPPARCGSQYLQARACHQIRRHFTSTDAERACLTRAPREWPARRCPTSAGRGSPRCALRQPVSAGQGMSSDTETLHKRGCGEGLSDMGAAREAGQALPPRLQAAEVPTSALRQPVSAGQACYQIKTQYKHGCKKGLSDVDAVRLAGRESPHRCTAAASICTLVPCLPD